MDFRTVSARLALALLAAAFQTAPAFAQNGLCIQDAYNTSNGVNKTLSCTANDVSIANVVPGSVTVFQGGVNDKCLAGGKFSFTADFSINTTSSSPRSNIGIFFAGGSQSQAKTGSCSDSILSAPHPCATDPSTGKPTATCGSGEYEELDTAINGETAAANGCGDTSSSDGNGTGIQHSVLEVDGITCPQTASDCPASLGFPAGQTCMALNYCTGWYQPAKGMPSCTSPTWSWVPTAVPGTTSKCDCSIVYLPIQPIQPAISVTKSCNTALSTGTGLALCDAGQEGSTVTYTVTVANTTPSGEGGVIIDQICDNQYGSIYRSNTASNTLKACAAGAITNVTPTFTGCSTYDVTSTPAACTFTVPHGESLTVIDIATVNGESDLATTYTPTPPASSKTVEVDSSDAPTTATTFLGLEPGPQSACVTLRYDVTVQNTSAADESVKLDASGTVAGGNYMPALMDPKTFGDITSTHGTAAADKSVTGTTCGVATTSAGLGTLSKSFGAGTFPQTLAPGTGTPPTSNGGKYMCTFDGVICGAPNSTNIPNCSAGLSAQSSITPNLTGDEVAVPFDKITVNAKTFTANVCLVQSGS